MARRIIIRERIVLPNGDQTFDYTFWLAVPTARQTFYASGVDPNNPTAVIDATVTEKNAITGGSITEVNNQMTVPNGTPLATAQASLVQSWQSEQTRVNAYNPWAYYGSSWDQATGTWTIKQTA